MTTDAIPRYPLAWPLGWTRTAAPARKRGAFTSYRASIGIPAAVQRLQDELDRLGAVDLTLSTNLRPRLDGGVVANAGEPLDPGVAVYFRFRNRASVFACDRYQRVADNIAAIAAHADALRRIERYGVGTLDQALAGYRSLPADSAADWRGVFGFTATARVTAEQLTTAYRARAQEAHPDHGGSDAGMAHLNRARDFALAELLG